MDYAHGDTIAAISTPTGEAGLGVIRLSGPDALPIVGRVFAGNLPQESHRVAYGRVLERASGEAIDEVLVAVFRGPRSYTREDVVEIGCHGGPVVMRRVMRALLKAGARAAGPGEFTARAYLNGRIDLAQAEAVLDLIRAKTGSAAAAALSQVEGALSGAVRPVRSALIEILAMIEAAIDFPDEVEEPPRVELLDSISRACEVVERLLKTGRRGRILREGLRVAICGRPNVGKSSLLNAMLSEERAIVTDVPGTTRDVIEESADIFGVPVTLVDMAGLRETRDAVEMIGVERAKREIGAADVVVVVIDDSEGALPEDIDLIRGVLAGSGPVVIAINKIDLGAGRAKALPAGGEVQPAAVVRVSAKTGEGLEALEKAIVEAAAGAEAGASGVSRVVVTNMRHMDALERAMDGLQEAARAVRDGLPVDLASLGLRDAANALGEISGETASDDVVERIFERFCVGK